MIGLAELFEQRRHVVGKRRRELEPLTGLWMGESELGSMKRRAVESEGRPASAVSSIADHRMVDRLEVNADLVRSASVERAGEERDDGVIPRSLDGVRGPGRLAIVSNNHTSRVADGPADWSLHDPSRCRRVPPRHREVAPSDRPVAQLRGQGLICELCPGDHEDP